MQPEALSLVKAIAHNQRDQPQKIRITASGLKSQQFGRAAGCEKQPAQHFKGGSFSDPVGPRKPTISPGSISNIISSTALTLR